MTELNYFGDKLSEEIMIEENDSKKILGLKITVTDFKDVFTLDEKGIRVSTTEFELFLKTGKKEKLISANCGSKIDFDEYSIIIKDCATGTRDWKSFAKIKIEKKN